MSELHYLEMTPQSRIVQIKHAELDIPNVEKTFLGPLFGAVVL